MKRQISFSQYRMIDLVILMVLLAASQLLIFFATSSWFPEQLYVVSPVAGVVALVMMRWSGYAAIHAALGGVLFALLAGGSWQQMVIYGAGNLASMLALGLFKSLGKERVRQDAVLAVAFAVCTQILMLLGRAGVALLFAYEPAACLGFITTDSLSVIFTIFIIWIVRPIEGLFEDQKQYLLRIQSEQEDEGREQF